MDDALVWLGVLFTAVMNFRLGFLIRTWGALRTREDSKETGRTVGAVALGLTGLGLVVLAKGRLELNFLQAVILAGCVFLGSVWARVGYGLDVPAEERSAYLNRRVHAVKQICERHGWDVSSPESVNHLADGGRFHFDEADLEVIVQLDGEREHEFGAAVPPLLTREGKPDFDRSCARRIVSLTNALTGSAGLRGVVTNFEQRYVEGLPGFDHDGLQDMRRLADGLVRQWGMERLYAQS